jgi:hypothetical protein
MDFPADAVEAPLVDGLAAIQVNDLGATVFGHDFGNHGLATSFVLKECSVCDRD